MTHYFSEKQDSDFTPKKIIVRQGSLQFPLMTAQGVFSRDRPDFGSMVLVEYASGKVKGDIHDLGCGYGYIGIALKLRCPDCNVSFSDINERAVKLARINAELNGIQADVQKIDGVPKNRKFDYIVLNPPISAGRKICYRLIEEAKPALKEGGFLIIVARKQKGGRMLESHMKGVFGNAKDVHRKGGFHVYESRAD